MEPGATTGAKKCTYILLDPVCLHPLLFAILSSNLHDRFHSLSIAQILQFIKSRLHLYLQCSTKCVTLYMHYALIHTTHTHILHVAWIAFDSTLKRLQDLVYNIRFCWCNHYRETQILGQTKEMVLRCYSCPEIQLLTPLSPNASQHNRFHKAFMHKLFPAFPLPLAPRGMQYVSPGFQLLEDFN